MPNSLQRFSGSLPVLLSNVTTHHVFPKVVIDYVTPVSLDEFHPLLRPLRVHHRVFLQPLLRGALVDLTVDKIPSKQAAVLKQKAVEYNGDTHAINVFANGATETEKAQFIKNASPEVVERCKWESRQIEFPGAGKNFNLTAQGKIATVPRLSAIWDSMVEAERSYVASEKAAMQEQREQAAARLRELEAASGSTPQPPRLAGRARVGAE